TALVAHAALGWVRGVASGLWPGLVFPLVFCAFHFASLGDLVIGWYNERLFPFAWNLSVVCLLAWMVGYGATRGSLRFVERPAARLGRRELGPRELHRIATLGALVLVAGFGLQLAVHVALGMPSFGAVSYLQFKAAMTRAGGLGAAHLFGQMCCVVGVTVTVCASALGYRRLFYARWVAAVVGVYLLSLFFQGDRSEMSVIVFPLLLARHYFIRAFPLRRVVMFGVLAVMFFAGIKMYRGTGSMADFVSSATDREWVLGRTSDETGGTLDTVIRSLELVPEHDDYFRGATYGYALMRVVPNIVLQREDAGFVSSQWVTNETTKNRVVGKGGLGFSIVAEAYINFGAIGAPFVL
ncbi:MAG: oligosaccharide repeat unit polymerase, partial [Myxococcales bacterium]|nr:oligosaccharide repeat unit polymerase [Myxococcales bacterium]